jgi:hypothetical protein
LEILRVARLNPAGEFFLAKVCIAFRRQGEPHKAVSQQQSPRLRREQIELQVATITPLMHVKGYAAPEVKAATQRARLLIEQAEALGEPPENPLLLYSVLLGHAGARCFIRRSSVKIGVAKGYVSLALLK